MNWQVIMQCVLMWWDRSPLTPEGGISNIILRLCGKSLYSGKQLLNWSCFFNDSCLVLKN